MRDAVHYTIQEAMRELRLSRPSIYRKLKQGILRRARTGRAIRGRVRSVLLDGESVRALKRSGLADMRRVSRVAGPELRRMIRRRRRREAKKSKEE